MNQLRQDAERILALIVSRQEEQFLEERLAQLDALIQQGVEIDDIITIPDCEAARLIDLSMSTIQYVLIACRQSSYTDHLLFWLAERLEPDTHNIRELEHSEFHHALEELLKRREDTLYFQRCRLPKPTEILLGFGLLDMESRVSYNGNSHFVLPIERLMIDYASCITKGSPTQEQLIQNILLFHRHGSPRASFKQMRKFITARNPMVESEAKLVEIWKLTYDERYREKNLNAILMRLWEEEQIEKEREHIEHELLEREFL